MACLCTLASPLPLLTPPAGTYLSSSGDASGNHYCRPREGVPARLVTGYVYRGASDDDKPVVLFDPNSTEPTFVVRHGEVEDWTIENRSRESHAFHVHQLHFIVVGSKGSRWEEPTLRDTIDLPAWNGLTPYPSITVRMDFRDPAIVGTFPFHCHILQHLDGGMMGTVRVEAVPLEQTPPSKQR